jgi:hypothetical protein
MVYSASWRIWCNLLQNWHRLAQAGASVPADDLRHFVFMAVTAGQLVPVALSCCCNRHKLSRGLKLESQSETTYTGTLAPDSNVIAIFIQAALAWTLESYKQKHIRKRFYSTREFLVSIG